MIEVFRRTGFPVRSARDAGRRSRWSSRPRSPRRRSPRYEERERIAAANAVRAVLEPTSVAVIGASRDPPSIGGRLLHNLLDPPFAGVVYPVNPTRQRGAGRRGVSQRARRPRARSTWRSSPCPRRRCSTSRGSAARRACGARRDLRRIRRRRGADGRALQHELLEVCRASGMRLIGPNCMGVVNTDPEVAAERHVRRDLAAARAASGSCRRAARSASPS